MPPEYIAELRYPTDTPPVIAAGIAVGNLCATDIDEAPYPL